jgi:hypothetical protein
MPYDYTQAPPQRETELIPHNTVARVALKIRAGGVGEDGLLTRSKKGDCEMLDLEFTAIDGPYVKRKFWQNLTLAGATAGHAKAAEVSRTTLRGIIESARGINPKDVSPQARRARTADLKDFDGLIFTAKIGVEKGKPKNDGSGENWPDRNILAFAITPDQRDWHPVEQPPPFNGGGGGTSGPTPPASAPIAKPAWAS